MSRTDDSALPEVTFYTKAGCHLCDDAREMLEEVASRGVEYLLTERDIRSDEALFERYRYRIPVIMIDQEEVLEGRIELADVEQAFGL
ncbi:MAG TPA: glutaredoxin family protein [Ktedonobacteraceae bacterium]|nr:glutaredoxin family protein [Ktedonobacteraceae bacterium]